jgi:uncharacterized RDD family membrane protein YckC
MYFAETIVRNPGATFEARVGAALIDTILLGAAVFGLSALAAAAGAGALVSLENTTGSGGLTSRYGFDLFGIVRVVLETFARPDAAGPSYSAFASVFAWGSTEIVVSAAGVLLFLGAGLAYFIGFETAFGATPGKLAFGARVRDETNRPAGQGAVVARNLWKLMPLGVLLAAFPLAGLIGGVGLGGAPGVLLAVIAFLVKAGALGFAALSFGCAAFAYRNRALHDMMAKTRVIIPSS